MTRALALHLAVLAALFAAQFLLPSYHHTNIARIMVLAVFETVPDSVRVPVPFFVSPEPLVMSEPIVAAVLAVIAGLEPAKPSVPPVTV